MNQIDIALASVGAAVLCIGVFSQAIKRNPLQEPLLAVGIGVLIGPFGLEWLDITAWADKNAVLEEVSRLTLAVGLMAVALRITRADMRRLCYAMSQLLTIGMLGMWLISSLLAAGLFDMPFWMAALLAATMTPTDPVVASSIVTGKFAETHLPGKLRASLSLESGANDGLAYLLVMLPIFMLDHSPENPWQRWLLETLLIGIVLAVAVGAALGFLSARLLHWAKSLGLMERYSFLTFTVALSLFTLGAARLVSADALISIFVAGIAFNLSSDTGEKHEEENIQEAVSKLFTLPMFVIFGLALPWAEWAQSGWRLAVFAVLILMLRRIPVIAALFPTLRGTYSVRDAAFIGWFGPIGVAGVYYATFAVRHTGDAFLWEAASAGVLASILAHGVTAAPFSRLYARSP